jgi:hypothetical protein
MTEGRHHHKGSRWRCLESQVHFILILFYWSSNLFYYANIYAKTRDDGKPPPPQGLEVQMRLESQVCYLFIYFISLLILFYANRLHDDKG